MTLEASSSIEWEEARGKSCHCRMRVDRPNNGGGRDKGMWRHRGHNGGGQPVSGERVWLRERWQGSGIATTRDERRARE